MNDKLKTYISLFEQEIKRLSNSPDYFRSFLRTSGRLYKYSFKDQVLIHAQRPDSVACAEYDTWGSENITNRFVKRGSKGIALIDDTGQNTKIRYVFDFYDTGVKDERSKKPFFWRITDENENLVINELDLRADTIGAALVEKANDLVDQHTSEYLRELIYNKEGSFLEELDDLNVQVRFEHILKDSVAFMILSRCGIDAEKYIDDDAFDNIYEFNTIETMCVLGTATSELSEQVLRNIELTLKNYERSKNNERNEVTKDIDGERIGVYSGRENRNISSELEEVKGEANRQVWTAQKDVLKRTSQSSLSVDVDERKSEPTSDGDKQHGSEKNERDNPSDAERTGRDRKIESNKPDEVGRDDEQHQEISGGDNSERTDLRLKTEQRNNKKAVSEEKSDTAFSVIEEAKDRINEYCLNEFGDEADFSNLSHVSLAFTTDEDSFVPIEVYANLNDFKIITLYDGNVALEKSFESLEKMLGTLGNLEFDELVALSDEEKSIIPSVSEQAETLDVTDTFDIEPDIEEGGGYREAIPKQLSLFGDEYNEPIHEPNSKKKASEKHYGNPHIEEIFRDEIMRGSGFADGKFRIDSFYQENKPDIKEFAKFLSKEYGTGGHSGVGEVSFADHNAKGIHITFEDGSNITWSWNEIAKRTAVLINKHEYITPEDLDQRIRSATIESFKEKTEKNFKPINNEIKATAIEREIKQYAENIFSDNNIEAIITGIAISGSRSRGIEKDNSDIDIVIEVKSDIKEYALFNLLHEKEYTIGGVKVDINPIRPEETGTLESYLVNASEYLDEKTSLLNDTKEVDDINALVGKSIDYDGGKFKVTDIKESFEGKAIELQDLSNTGWFPIFRIIKEDEFYEKGFTILNESTQNQFEEPESNKEARTESVGEKHNFIITDDNLEKGGPKSKYKVNVEAIKLLNKLESEKRFATKEEQEKLSRYVGWGGLPQVFDENNSSWSAEFAELQKLLAPDEYEDAKASTLTAFYTNPMIITAIYDGLANLGFKKGNVLEPAMGVGNFFGTMPERMKESKLYGVELDSISGRIAKQLYQTADIQVTGFEKTQFPDNFFDVAVGNVPFGQFKLSEKRYDKLNLNIHDHFFAKSLDKVRAGGVIAFVTSKGTLDKANPKFRKYLAQRAELLGAVRLPNNAFKNNAGTDVTSDIIFLQKRDKMLDIEPEWVNLGMTADGVPVNKYFEEHPEMILGEMKKGIEFSMYGNAEETACVAIKGANLKAQLKEAIANIQGQIPEVEYEEKEKAVESIPADPSVKNFSYTVVDDNIYYRENSRMFLKDDLPKVTAERIKGMVELRDCVRKLIDYQLNEYSDNDIKAQQSVLNDTYDRFTKKYGLINSKGNSSAFAEDSAYYLLSSLEVLDENGELERKADMFTKRTINQKAEILSVDTASEALAVSISEKAGVDMDFMKKLTGKREEQIYTDLKGIIFLNPLYVLGNNDTQKYLTSDEYLSGNIREKLELAKRTAELYPEDYSVNIDALTKAMPKPLEASEIDVRLGATWIDTDIIKEFICETLQVPRYMQNLFDVKFSEFTSEWKIEGKNVDRSNVMATVTFGTSRKNAYSIIEDTLNLRDARVYDRVEQPDGKIISVLNKKETMIAQEKQEAIKNTFKDWIFKDPKRREKLVEKYNVLFNSSKPREYDGSHITFSGMSPEIQLRPHQLNAIAHTLYGGNTLLAHQVGAGKTFEMVASAMESKRLGLCTKSLFVVPNHLTEQMGAEFLRLYPSANILVATKKDFQAKNRKRLCSKIATGDYDAVIIGHSQLEKIPISNERQQRMLRNQIENITEGINSFGKTRGNHFSVKQLEKTKKKLEAKLDKLLNSPDRDDVVTFEELGVDKMFIDEAHNFKNLFLYTKMRNVAGIQQTEAQKSSDLYMKCQYLDELTGGKGIVFATGTPVSNSMTELYTMMRYLQADKLKEMGMHNFDAWAANFGEAVTAIELAPEGTGYRAKTRFSKFFNLPELINVFKEVADIKTADMLNLPVPEAEFHNVVVKPSDIQKDMVSGLSDRAKRIHDKSVDPTEDNMLKVTNDGRKIGLDQRLIDPLLPDVPDSKVNACVSNVFDIYHNHDETKSTQLIFCDFSTPKNDGSFNLYDDIRDKLVEKGIPKEEVAFIHEADNEAKKRDLFSKVRKGQVRVLIGSTAKCGAGTNIQDKLIALHHLDCPWRPSDLEQREGRIIRQGNENSKVDIFRYMTEATFDAYLYQTIENKQRFISQIMSSKSPVRSCEDVDEATLSYAEVKALCAGNPLIKEKMDLDVAVTKLKVSKANHVSQQYNLEDNVIKHFPNRIAKTEQRIACLESDLAHIKSQSSVTEGISPMRIMNQTYTEKEEAGKALLLACRSVKAKESVDIGKYRGFNMSLSYDSFNQEFHLNLQRDLSYSVTLGTSETGNISRIDNTLDGIEKRLENAKVQLETLNEQLETAKTELGKPFPQEEELQKKLSRLSELNTVLNIDGNATENTDVSAEKENDVVKGKDDYNKTYVNPKTSILNRISEIKEHQNINLSSTILPKIKATAIG